MTDPMTSAVEFASADGLGVIRLNRPDNRNAIDPAFVDDLHEAVQRCAADETLRALLIRAEGPSLHRRRRRGHAWPGPPPGELPATLRRMTTSYHAALQLLDRLPVPVVAAVHGAVAGGGLGLIYVADLVLAAEGTRFTAGFGGLGLSGRRRRHLVPAAPGRHAPGGRAVLRAARPERRTKRRHGG